MVKDTIFLPINALINGDLATYKVLKVLSVEGYFIEYLVEVVFYNQSDEEARIFSNNLRILREFYIPGVNGRNKDDIVTCMTASSIQTLKKRFIDRFSILKNHDIPHVSEKEEIFEANNTVYFVADYIEGLTKTTMPLPIGTVLHSDQATYIVLKVLGIGTYTISYAVEILFDESSTQEQEPPTNRILVLKEFFINGVNGRNEKNELTEMQSPAIKYYKTQFIERANILLNKKLDHVAPTEDVFEANNTAYYVMEYIDGVTLRNYAKTHPVSEREAVEIVRSILGGASQMGNRYILNLNLNVDGIFRKNSDGSIIVQDFGLPKHKNDEGLQGAFRPVGQGTLGYAAPELAEYRQESDGCPFSIDIYSIGAILFALYTSKRPSDSQFYKEDFSRLESVVRGRIVNVEIQNIILKAMNPDPKQRYQTMEEMDEALAKVSLPNYDHEEGKTDKEIGSFVTSWNNPKNRYIHSKKKTVRYWIRYCVLALISLIVIADLLLYFQYSVVKDEKVCSFINTNNYTEGLKCTVNGVSFTMIKVEGGLFKMGSHDAEGNENERTVHPVEMKDFYIGKTEVTQELWEAVMGSNPSEFSGYNLPVDNISWNDCFVFVYKLNYLTKMNFRIPTEAEWEYASRGGNKGRDYKYAGSNDYDDIAWCGINSENRTHSVASKEPNELGIYDMSGNICEWCFDWMDFYSHDRVCDPMGAPDGVERILRGGSWNSVNMHMRVSNRRHEKPEIRSERFGLRLAL